jgi:hypothetical protein
MSEEFNGFGGYGPLFEISILIKVRKVDDNANLKDGNDTLIDISKEDRIYFLNKLFDTIKNEFDEIEIKQNENIIKSEIKMYWDNPIIRHRCLSFIISLNLGYKRNAVILLETRDDENLLIDIQFLEEDENDPSRDEANNFLKKMMEKLKGYCGTIGVEADALDIGFDEEYGIINIIRNELYV